MYFFNAVIIFIAVPPKNVEIENHANGSTLEVREAERIALTCVSRHSKPAAKLKWYRNGVLFQGGEFIITQVMTKVYMNNLLHLNKKYTNSLRVITNANGKLVLWRVVTFICMVIC